MSHELLNIIDKVSISPGYRTDHSLIEIHIKLTNNKRGRGVWRFNNALLKEKEYIEMVKHIIKETKREYSNIPENEINDLTNEEIPMNIPDDLFLETLLLKIRGATIPYCAANKRNRENQKKSLLEKN